MIEIQGNGKIVSREINVSTFIRLHLACKGHVELYQSDEEKVVIETDENLQDHFSASNAGRTLYVSSNSKLKRPVFTSLKIKVFLRQLDVLNINNDSGEVYCPKTISLMKPLDIKNRTNGFCELDFVVPALKVLNQANGNLVLKGKCERLEITNQANGDLNTERLFASELHLRNMSNGNSEVRADQKIRITHLGNGYVHYFGEAVVDDVKQYGTGEVKRMRDKVAV